MHLLISWKGFSDVSPHSCPTALGENSPKWSQKRWERSLWEVGGGRWEVGDGRWAFLECAALMVSSSPLLLPFSCACTHRPFTEEIYRQKQKGAKSN